MRTSIFTKYAKLKNEFKEDIQFLWNLPNEQRKAIIPFIKELYKAETEVEWETAVERALSEIEGSSEENLRMINILIYIYREWNPISDTPSNFLKDLEELHLIPEEKKEDVKSYLLEFFSIVETDNLRRLQKIYAGALLPSFKAIQSIVDFRPIFKNPYGSNLDYNIENYHPNFIDFIPIILVKIERDNSFPQMFEFQVEEKHLDEIINILKAAKKDLETSKLALFERRDASD